MEFDVDGRRAYAYTGGRPFDPALPVVAMVHGWGHAASPRLRVANQHPGANPNALLPIGEGSFEPLSSQAHMTGIPVQVRAAVAVPAAD